MNNTLPVSINDTSKTFLALGDSYTIGESVNAEQRFPAQTALLLSGYGIKINTPDYIATTGWTTQNLQDAINNKKPANNYSIVTLLIGVNNQYQGLSFSDYKNQFTSLLQQAIGFAGNNKNHVFVVSIPDYSVTPFARNRDTARIAREIDQYNAANKSITESFGVSYTDITPISREAKNNPDLVASDGLHPSASQYQRWAALLAPTIKAHLQ
ncbi:MAG: SGNH/GDSL hydrolase family protein [Ginsengibacter sp.]